VKRGYQAIYVGVGAAAAIVFGLWWSRFVQSPTIEHESVPPALEMTRPSPAPIPPPPPVPSAEPAPIPPVALPQSPAPSEPVAALPPAPSPPPVAPPAPLTLDRQVIARVQFFLEQLGYSVGVADGVMGRRTKTAVAAFRRSHGLPPGEDIDGRLFDALELAHRQLPKGTEGVPAAAPRIPVVRVPLSN
jgi:hypothetical protein